MPSRAMNASLCLSIGALLSLGCGGNSSTATATGVVSLDGQPLETGTVDFIPVAGTKGPAATATIADGKFTIPAEAKLKPGKFRVEISAQRVDGKQQVMSVATGEEVTVDRYVSIIPPRYNRDTELNASLAAGPNKLTFPLKSK